MRTQVSQLHHQLLADSSHSSPVPTTQTSCQNTSCVPSSPSSSTFLSTSEADMLLTVTSGTTTKKSTKKKNKNTGGAATQVTLMSTTPSLPDTPPDISTTNSDVNLHNDTVCNNIDVSNPDIVTDSPTKKKKKKNKKTKNTTSSNTDNTNNSNTSNISNNSNIDNSNNSINSNSSNKNSSNSKTADSYNSNSVLSSPVDPRMLDYNESSFLLEHRGNLFDLCWCYSDEKFPELYLEENSGKVFVSIDLRCANFNALKLLNPALVLNEKSWDSLLQQYVVCPVVS